MFQPTVLSIALRYVISVGERFALILSLFSLSGLIIGVIALITVMSVMNGFSHELHTRIFAAVPHAFIFPKDKRLADWQSLTQQLEERPDVLAAAPYIGGDVMVAAHGRTRGIELKAILPAQEKRIAQIADRFTVGTLNNLIPGQYGIVLGNLLAKQLRVDIGDKVMVTLPQVNQSLLGVFPRSRRFQVVGLFALGNTLDATTAFINLQDGQRLYRTGNRVHGIQIKTPNRYDSLSIATTIANELQYNQLDWSVIHATLFRAIRIEKNMMFLMLLVVILVAAFNIVALMSISVSNRKRDIAVLRTLGMTRTHIVYIVLLKGMILSVCGVGGGFALGLPLAYWAGDIVAFWEEIFGIYLFDPNLYFITKIPSVIYITDVLLIGGSAILLGIVATFYPAWYARDISVIEELRWE